MSSLISSNGRRTADDGRVMGTFTMSVIPRANALALQGYRHCCHVMLHSPVEEKLFGFYPVKHAVLVSNPHLVYAMPVR